MSVHTMTVACVVALLAATVSTVNSYYAANVAALYSPHSSHSPSSSALCERRQRPPTTPDRRWEVRPIGVVRSPYLEKFQTPKQATISRTTGQSVNGTLELFAGFEECISDLEGFDYVWVLTMMHLNSGFKTKIRPQPVPDAERQPPSAVGLFSSRAPHRPNPIALSALAVTGVDVSKGIVYVHGLDLLDDTPILDIKPYIPAFDSFPDARAGWMDIIRSDVEASRKLGYQSIHSPRGARAARAHQRTKSTTDSEDVPIHGEGR